MGYRLRPIALHYQACNPNCAVDASPALPFQIDHHKEISRKEGSHNRAQFSRVAHGLESGRQKRPIDLRLELISGRPLAHRLGMHRKPPTLAIKHFARTSRAPAIMACAIFPTPSMRWTPPVWAVYGDKMKGIETRSATIRSRVGQRGLPGSEVSTLATSSWRVSRSSSRSPTPARLGRGFFGSWATRV